LRRGPKKAIVPALTRHHLRTASIAQPEHCHVIFLRFPRTAAIAGLTALIVAAPVALSAQAPTDGPTSQELSKISAAGTYLAARHAGQQRDARTAATYYRATLRHDPKNSELLDRTFLSLLVAGEVSDAVPYADRILHADKNDRVARLVAGVHALKSKQYGAARRDVAQSVRGPITDLAATLLNAWALYGSHDAKAAVASIDKLTGPDWYTIFKELHAGLILDASGNAKEAGKRFEHAYKLDSSALRVVQAYGGWLSRNGKMDEARKIFTDYNNGLPRHPLVLAAMATLGPAPSASAEKQPPAVFKKRLTLGAQGDEVKAVQEKLGVATSGEFDAKTQKAVREFQSRNNLKADGTIGPRTFARLFGAADKQQGRALPLLVNDPQTGAAEALYGLGASLGRRGGEDLGLVYLQLSLYLSPNHALALLSLADLYESLKKPELAIKAYERVPANSPLRRNAAIQMAANLDTLDRPEEAKKHLRGLISEHPDDLEAIMALGNVLRAHKDFAECADNYTKAIDLIKNPTKAHWTLFYFRGICYERSKQWPKAEADLKKALELFPEQPHVLNYLGYSWIDQGAHLDKGMEMIKLAVSKRPDDGYIVDSLGWAYFRTGNYEEAAKQLERAIELKPEDPTINDHLGDAYWRVGRHLEARFQWAHARDLKPDPDDLPKILSKLKDGLPEENTSTAKAGKKEGNGG
jgi:tetratricopeptide (TPR) repeat protein